MQNRAEKGAVTEMVSYETALAHMQEQMRKAAVWRMQRTAIDARRAIRRDTRKAEGTGSWIAAISRAFGGDFKSSANATDSFSDN